MASSGTLSTSYYSTRRYDVKWSSTESIETNQSTISWTIYAVETGSDPYLWYMERDLDLYINGSNVYSKSNKVERREGTVASGTTTITHNKTGEASLKIELNVAVYYTYTTCSGSSTWTLPVIPRASKPTVSQSEFQIGVLYSNAILMNSVSSGFTHSIYYIFKDKKSTEGISPNTGVKTSADFTPPLWLTDYIPDETSGDITFYVTTYDSSSNNNLGTNTISATLLAPSGIAPELVINISDANNYKNTFGAYVEGKSKLYVTFDESPKSGSTIKSRSLQMNGQNYTSVPATSGYISLYNTEVVGSITDSRGNTTRKSHTIEILPYHNPYINSFSVSRCDSSGNPQDDGLYALIRYSVDISTLNRNGTNQNSKKLQVIYQSVSGGKSITIELPFDNENNDYTAYGSKVISNISDNSAYDFSLIASDYFTETKNSLTLSTASTPMDFGCEGKGIGLLKVSTKSGYVEVGGNLDIDGDYYKNGVLWNPSGGNADHATTANKAYTVSDYVNKENLWFTYQPMYNASDDPYICAMKRGTANGNDPEMRVMTESEVAKMIKPHLNIPVIPPIPDNPEKVNVSGWDEAWKFPTGLMIIKYWSYEYSNFHAWGNGYEMELTKISKKSVPSGTFVGNPSWFLGASSYYNEMTPNGWYPEMEAGTATQTPACFAVRPKSGSSGNAIGYCLMGIGRWK